MFAVFASEAFLHFTAKPTAVEKGQQALPLAEAQLLRLRTIYRSGFTAVATKGPAGGVLVTATTERRPVSVRLWVREEEGGGIATVTDLHLFSQEAAGEKAAEALEALTKGKLVLSIAQGEARAIQAVRDLLEIHPAPTRPNLLESFQGLWTAAHVDMRDPLTEGLRNALTALKERGITKQVEKALVDATVQRAALAA